MPSGICCRHVRVERSRERPCCNMANSAIEGLTQGEVVMRKLAFKTLAASAVAAILASGAYAAGVLGPDSDEELVPTGKGWGERAQPGHANPNAKPSTNGINYHGGPLILS